MKQAEKVYSKKYVVMEGQLKIQRLPCILPINCNNKCLMTQTFLTGHTKTEEIFSSLTHLEKTLEALNGKDIKITIEWNN